MIRTTKWNLVLALLATTTVILGPTRSHMFRNLIPALADKHRVVAPDYPGYGHSSMPSRDKFAYTFDNLAKVIDDFTEKVGLTKYALYVQDYGAPVGYRLAVKH